MSQKRVNSIGNFSVLLKEKVCMFGSSNKFLTGSLQAIKGAKSQCIARRRHQNVSQKHISL